MPIYNSYPYTNLHQMNLDEIVMEVESFKAQLASLSQQINQITGYLEAISVSDTEVDIDRNVVIDGSLTATEIVGDFNIDAASADKLNVNGGAADNPVYFSNGVPTATGATLTKNITGNAGSADKWSTARSITLQGDVTGSTFIDGSGNVSMLTTIQGTTPSEISTIPNDLTIDGNLTLTTGHNIVQGNLNGNAATATTLTGLTATVTELNYVDGVTSDIQTQLNGKQATITGAATTVTSSNLTTSRALISNSSGKIAVSSISSTKLGYLTDVTSNIQAQINGKQSTITYGTTDPDPADGNIGDIYIKVS